VAARRDTVKSQIGPALYRAMKPGDQIVAGMRVQAGLTPQLDLMICLPCAAFTAIAGIVGIGAGFATGLAAWFVPLVLQFGRRPVFIAVTSRELICYRVSRLDSEPGRLMFRAPLTAVRMTSSGRGALRWRSVRYSGPGAGQRPLRLHAAGRWREDLDQVLTALQAGGARVEGPLALSPGAGELTRR
jgi:hypothetical protein